MLIFITGGAASGKSEQAEQIICENTDGKRLYLATMQPSGKAAQERIARHRRLRQGKHFSTIERPRKLDTLSLPARYDGILLEDLGNLTANELFPPAGTARENIPACILDGIANLQRYCTVLVVVSNEVFSDGLPYNADTIRYIRTLGQIHQALAGRADSVYEAVCGCIPEQYREDGGKNHMTDRTVLLIGGAYQGKTRLAQILYPALPLVRNLHLLVWDRLQKKENPQMLLASLRGHCVTCNEIGCGVVPLEREQERWREETGRLCCALAAEADTVIRVFAGIPQYLKGQPPCG